MAKIDIYTTATCPSCKQAKRLFDKKGVEYSEIRVDLDDEKLAEMMARSQRRTVPQIFINDQSIGGFDDLWALEQQGKLDPLLN
jgi:glutaredoxin 3